MQKNLWMALIPLCLLTTGIAVVSVRNGIAGIALRHLLHLTTAPYWVGMSICVGVALGIYLLLGVSIRNALRLRKSLGERL